jgi:hypothetical protein
MRTHEKCFHGLLYVIFIILILRAFWYEGNFKILISKNNTVKINTVEPELLLIYVYAQTNVYALGNLQYFIETAVRDTDPADYYFILQQSNNQNLDEGQLPKLPDNAHYIHHENKCFDYGTAGWFFSEFTTGNPYENQTLPTHTKKKDLRKYKYFIFLNSSIRGPYFPPYYLALVSLYESRLGKKYYWYSAFTERITETVKLVGPLISCERSVHIQGHMVVTDFIGLSVALKHGDGHGVFDCHQHFEEAINFGEIGFTTRILAAGYMIDCLMTRYQKINFNAPVNRGCNSGLNPQVHVDGVSLDPYEMVFIKFNYKRNDGVAADRAQVYAKWIRELENNTSKY